MDGGRLEDLLECAICLERLDERSRVLPCQHTFCIKCLGIMVQTKGHLQCPECRTDFQQLNINSLPRNVLLVRILEGLKNNNGQRSKESENTASKEDNGENADIGTNWEKNESIRPKETAKRLSAKVKYEALLNQPCARALHNFHSSEDGDLSFKKGDIITLTHEIDDNWFEGCLGNKRGSIPKNFIETLVPLPKIHDDTIKHPFAKALYSYESKEEPEVISFREGDIIGVIKKVDSKWFEGILGGQYGIFPVNFVQLNKAGKNIMSGDNSTSSSSSDEENDTAGRKRGKRSSRSKTPQLESPWVKKESHSTAPANDTLSKRHTIHIENPNEQQRQSRRALNLDDQPQQRVRAQSQGRKPESSASVERTLASTVLLTRALRGSDEQLTRNGIMTTACPTSSLAMTTSIPEYRTAENVSRTLSTSPSNSISANIGVGELYTALFTYSPARDDELALIQGDQYSVLEKHLDGWFKGVHVRSQQSGVFPGNYVKLSSQVTQQMFRGRPPVIGYGSNPSSPNVPTTSQSQFTFPPQRSSTEADEAGPSGTVRANGESSSPGRGKSGGFMKLLKKNKNKRQTPPTPQTPQQPPSYYHSSMPGPTHVIARPSPNVPAEPPPPYTPTAAPNPYTTPTTTPTITPSLTSTNEIQTSNDMTVTSIISTVAGERFRAIETYPALNENELSLRAGDVVYVTKKHTDGWYTGKSARTGSTGVFPANFVEPHQ